jgi:ribosomal protein S12 methylthiotransferase accessory factor
MTNPFESVAPMSLPSHAPKAPGLSDRCVPLATTFAGIPELRKRYGITRVGDTTYLDRTEIPTFCAVVPNSPDLISVYNGKGRTREASMLSAVMEAVERQVAATVNVPTVPMRVRDVLEFVDLRAAGLREDALDLVTPCVAATEVLSGAVVPLPLAAVRCPWFGEKLFDTTSSNGLASGNTLTEALYHALTELIERHVWSMFYVRSQLVPRFFLGPEAPDFARADEIEFPCEREELDALVRRVQRAGLNVRAFSLAEPPLPSVVLAMISDSHAPLPMVHTGFGCSLSSAHALERALTECVQSRVVDIQAAREDVLRHDDNTAVFGTHGRRQSTLPHGRWYFDAPVKRVRLDSLPEDMTDDLAVDLAGVVTASRNYGIDGVYAIELSKEPHSVVRVVAPMLETTAVNGEIGAIARREFNPFFVRA